MVSIAVGVSVDIAIRIAVRSLAVVIDLAVAVVVSAIADLVGTWVDLRVRVVTVLLADEESIFVAVFLVLEDLAVAIVVHAVAQLLGAGMNLGVRIVAVLAGSEAIAVAIFISRRAVTVVVARVGAVVLLRSRMEPIITVVAVAIAWVVPVPVFVGLVVGEDAVAIVVETVAFLDAVSGEIAA
jgi:hypothetical protein